MVDPDFTYNLTFDEEGNLIEEETILREITWSVGYTLEEANQTIAVVNQLLPDLYLQITKHPNREEYALPWSEYIINNANDGALKDAINAKHDETLSEGNSKTREEMIAEGWINE